jgi:hypothetical protein
MAASLTSYSSGFLCGGQHLIPVFVWEQCASVCRRDWWRQSLKAVARHDVVLPNAWELGKWVFCSSCLQSLRAGRDWDTQSSTCEQRFWRGSVRLNTPGSHEGLMRPESHFLLPGLENVLWMHWFTPTLSEPLELISCLTDSKPKVNPETSKHFFIQGDVITKRI